MSFDETLETLAARIADSAKTIRSFRETTENALSSGKILDPTAPEDIQRARHTLLEASYEIHQLCSEPSEYLEQHQIRYQQLICLQWLLHFKILSHIPITTSVPFTSVAASANVPLARLKSVARMAMTGGLLSEPEPDHLAHSRISAKFVAEPEFLDWATFMTKYSAPTAAGFAEATERWGDTAEKNQTAYNVSFNTELSFFAHVSQSTDMSKTFAGYMRSMGKSELTAFKHILSGFDWAALGKVHIIDVGGSTAQASILLASHYSELEFTVQDLPDTISGSEAILSALDPSVASRITFAGQDFFKPQPASISASADVYFLRKIIHDWPFAEAKLILQNVVEAMKPGALILIMDTILPPPGGSASILSEAKLRVRDLTMAQSFNSKERELSDWEELFGSTTPKLKLKEYKQPFGSAMAIMVVEKDGF